MNKALAADTVQPLYSIIRTKPQQIVGLILRTPTKNLIKIIGFVPEGNYNISPSEWRPHYLYTNYNPDNPFVKEVIEKITIEDILEWYK